MKKSEETYRFGLMALTSLFFVWGFITCLNDILVPHLRAVFTLSYSQSALVQTCFFLAYFCSSLPAAAVVARFGYRHGLAIGLLTMAIGATGFLPAARLVSFPMFLGSLFILASGITLLQVVANPYVTLLGPEKTAPSRLNLTQAFNALGTTVAPLIGGPLILAGLASEGGAARSAVEQAASLKLPYLVIAVVLALLAVTFWMTPLPEPKEKPEMLSWQSVKQTFAHPTLKRGVAGICLYVGAEVSIGSFLVNLITSTLALAGGESQAAHFVSFYWGGAMLGRFVGSGLMRYVSSAKLLTLAAICAGTLVIISTLTTGYVSIVAMLAIGLFNSIMFPTIFSLGLQRLGPLTGVGSSLMVMAIVGGAVIPFLVGALADVIGLKQALILPVACYTYIAYDGIFNARWLRREHSSPMMTPSLSTHGNERGAQ